MLSSKSLYERGLRLNKKGQYAKAIRDFTRVIEMNPLDSDAYSDRAVAKFHLKDLVGALDDMNTAQRFDPENPYRYASRAYIREKCGDTEGAIEDYRKAIELDPDNAVSQNNLGLLEEKLGYMQMAKKRFKIADELADNLLMQEEITAEYERSQGVDDLLEELNIPKEGKITKGLFGQMLKVFTSSSERKDFLKFIGNLFRGRKH